MLIDIKLDFNLFNKETVTLFTENQTVNSSLNDEELKKVFEEKIKFLVPNINYDKYSWGWLNGNTEFYCSYFITLNNEFYMVAKKH